MVRCLRSSRSADGESVLLLRGWSGLAGDGTRREGVREWLRGLPSGFIVALFALCEEFGVSLACCFAVHSCFSSGIGGADDDMILSSFLHSYHSFYHIKDSWHKTGSSRLSAAKSRLLFMVIYLKIPLHNALVASTTIVACQNLRDY